MINQYDFFIITNLKANPVPVNGENSKDSIISEATFIRFHMGINNNIKRKSLEKRPILHRCS